VARGDQWATTSRVTNNVTGTTRRVTEGSGGGESYRKTGPGGSTTVGRTGSGDVYAGHDGNVYRKQGDSWQKYDNGGWNNANQPTPNNRVSGVDRATGTGDRVNSRPAGLDSATSGQLNRDSAARAEGTTRTRDASSARSGSTSRSGSYRPSGGGGARAGGGRRR